MVLQRGIGVGQVNDNFWWDVYTDAVARGMSTDSARVYATETVERWEEDDERDFWDYVAMNDYTEPDDEFSW